MVGRNVGSIFSRFLVATHIIGVVLSEGDVSAKFFPSSVKLQIGHQENITLQFSQPLQQPTLILFNYGNGDATASYTQDGKVIQDLPNITVPVNTSTLSVRIVGVSAGSITVGINSTSPEMTNLNQTFVKVTIVHSIVLDVFIAVIGWIYFVAWSISFYPQVYINWRRKSVIGLNFDFLALNLTGFIAYGFFNVGLFWIDAVKAEYFHDHPRGVNPVQWNDVMFTLHAVFITSMTIFQTLIYERGGQKVSRVCFGILALVWLFALVTLFVTVGKVITWLTYLYYFSYIKLGITLIKYIPQAWMNYKRKSTEGWSIGNVLLDFTGGSFSLLQMFLIAYNNDDWSSIFGDPTKFGLGAFSILFDILFIVQHYVLYRHTSSYALVNGDDSESPDPDHRE